MIAQKSVEGKNIFFHVHRSKVSFLPNDLIPPDQMSEVMTDIILMKNIKREASYIQDKEDLLVAEYLYEKHGIDSAQLASSQSYYAKNPKKYVPIFKKIQLELDRLNDSINESMRIKEE